MTNQSAFGWSSSNWSGYGIESNTAGTYDAISAQWTVPTVQATAQSQPSSWWGRLLHWLRSLFGGSSASTDTYSAAWIGIDGFNENGLIQTGTAQNVVNGKPQYYAWWEILPNPETAIDAHQYPVSGGDQVVASITRQANGNWSISMGNRTRGWVFQQTDVKYGGPQTSAEWIIEAPLVNGQVGTLANYGQTTFQNCVANGTDPYLQASQGGAMVQNGVQVSTPSLPGPNGDSFTIQYGSNQPHHPSS
ncbi:hypothetical protein JZ786_18695 [Alicyclobacillus mengziensis]|uniref:Peptidase A4 family protein n=1 Tax=Alicyclobacillus mengziensis TaxID=2931921 RepID=A0A9X7Z9Q2_9BACL|nr:hypothetical protein JZ786_18695 [Alicyclobacillus mengziensis]